MGIQLLHVARNLPAANDPIFSPRLPFCSRNQTLQAIRFDQQALLNALVLRGVPQAVAECLLFDAPLHQRFEEQSRLETATASGWQLKLIHHLHKNWQQLQRPRTVAGYLKNGRRIIYTENQCIRTPFSVR